LAADGTLAGTPTEPSTWGFGVTVTDAAGCSSTATFEIDVACPALALAPGALPGGTVGVAYSTAIAASGGTAPYAYALASGALPVGLALAADGTLAGTPAAGGGATFTVTATDAYGCTGSREYTLVVGCAPIAIARDTATAHVDLGYTS